MIMFGLTKFILKIRRKMKNNSKTKTYRVVKYEKYYTKIQAKSIEEAQDIAGEQFADDPTGYFIDSRFEIEEEK